MKDIVLLFKIVIDFLNSLNEQQLEDLKNKKVKLKLECLNEKQKTDIDDFEIKDIYTTVESFTTREEALNYLNGLYLNKNKLKMLVKLYNIPMASRATNAQMVSAIIEAAIGSQLKFNSLLNANLNK